MAYTYLVGWSKFNKYYYGARWAEKCSPDDLWVTYFTSSKHVKKFRKDHGEPDIIQVRKVFSNIEECRSYENKVLKKLDVLNQDKWLNKNINGNFLPTGKQSEEHIRNRIDSIVKNGKRKGLVAWTKKQNPEYANRVSNALKGKPKTYNNLGDPNAQKIACPYCSKIGNLGNMKRWHFNNCKYHVQSPS